MFYCFFILVGNFEYIFAVMIVAIKQGIKKIVTRISLKFKTKKHICHLKSQPVSIKCKCSQQVLLFHYIRWNRFNFFSPFSPYYTLITNRNQRML